MLPKANYGMPLPPAQVGNSGGYQQAYNQYMANPPMQLEGRIAPPPQAYAPREEYMYNYGGPTVPYTQRQSTAFSGNRGQGALQAGFNNATPGNYPAVGFQEVTDTQNVTPQEWSNLVMGDLNAPMGVSDTRESMTRTTGAMPKRTPMSLFFANGGRLPQMQYGGNLPKASNGMAMQSAMMQQAPSLHQQTLGMRPQSPIGMSDAYGEAFNLYNAANPVTPQPQFTQNSMYQGQNGYMAYGGNIPKASDGMSLDGIGDFLSSEQGGQAMQMVGQLAPMIGGMFGGNNKKPQEQYPTNMPMMSPYNTPYGNTNPYTPAPTNFRGAPGYGGHNFGGLNVQQKRALGQ
jgi:hypothetical protein